MAASCCFVQFPHPGTEHRPGPSGGRAWNTLTAAHARKFMQLSGEWIDTDDRTASGDLWAWGEWEPQSRLLRRLDGPEARGYPQHLWHPYYVIPDGGYRGLHNTDPFIFGERFLYSNCKQPTSPRLRSLDRGSVIAFGSSKKGRWVLDTVLVVAGFVDYQQTAVRSALAASVPETFLDVTGGPLAANSQHGKCGPALEELTGCGGGRRSRNGSDTALRLYWGATPQDPVHGMFSFFPGDAGGPRRGIPATMHRTPGVLFHRVAPAGPQAVLRPCRRDGRAAVGLTHRTSRRCWAGPRHPRSAAIVHSKRVAYQERHLARRPCRLRSRRRARRCLLPRRALHRSRRRARWLVPRRVCCIASSPFRL